MLFFDELGGLNGVLELRIHYLLPILYGATSFIVLFLMTITSTNYAVVKLSKNWKRLHRIVYLASFLIVIHALSLGSHFAILSKTIPVIFFIALVFLLLLEAIRFDHYLQKRLVKFPKFGIVVISTIIIIIIGALYIYLPVFSAIFS